MKTGMSQLFAIVLALLTVSACTVAVEQHPVPVRPRACTMEFAPVCARRGNQQRTFDNSCWARASGFQVVHRGQCRGTMWPGAGRPGACTREFDPVCARRGNQQRTFDNTCLARTSGFQVVHRGQCRATGWQGSGRPGVNRPGACTREFAPVCARRGNRQQTFDNACLARSDGFVVIRQGRCR